MPTQWFDELPSTNQHLRELLAADPLLPGGTSIAARYQTAGRGQFGRVWTSQAGQDLTFSFLLRSEVDLAWVPSLPMALALAIRETLGDFGIKAKVKWPNDVLVQNKKISGILAENVSIKSAASGETLLVIGIGLNINMSQEQAETIDQPATSIQIETGSPVAPEAVLESLLTAMARWIARWEEGGFPAIRRDWIAAAMGLGKTAHVSRPDGVLDGVLEDFGEHGELILKEEGGKRRLVWTGNLHVNGSEC